MLIFSLYAIITLILSIIFGIYLHLKYNVYNYFERHGVPYDKPTVPFGCLLPIALNKLNIGNVIERVYRVFKHHRFFGIFILHVPVVVINDTELRRSILVKEFSRFQNHGIYHNGKIDTLSNNLFSLKGQTWKDVRLMVSPAFTSVKVKQFFPLLQEVGKELVEACNRCHRQSEIVDVKDLTLRYIADTICSFAYGFNCNSLTDANSAFKRYGTMSFQQTALKFACITFAPQCLEIFSIPLLPTKVIRFFTKIFKEAIEYRLRNDIHRKDFLDSLMQDMDFGEINDGYKSNTNGNSEPSKKRMSFDIAIAQSFTLFLASYESSSTTVICCLYELALNPDVQRLAQEEIDGFLQKPEGITYDSINDMEYLHMMVLESLRKYPTLSFVIRECNEDYEIPDSKFVIKSGMKVIIPTIGIHYDPDIYPEPDKYNPLHFSKESVAARDPFHYLSFGMGPRACVGTRFGLLQVKSALISLLSEFEFSPCDKTRIPLPITKKSVTQTPEGNVYLKMTRRLKQDAQCC